MTSITQPPNLEETRRVHFLGWQCRIRQYSIRHDAGRPSAGMRPAVTLDGRPLGHVTVLIVKSDAEPITTQLRYMAKKTMDPAERYNSAIKFLSAAYYQRAREFSEQMTALFGPGSELARHLATHGRCELEFEQYNQRYRLACAVENLPEANDRYQATYWHNLLFNPQIPAGVMVLGFRPNWETMVAEPPVD